MLSVDFLYQYNGIFNSSINFIVYICDQFQTNLKIIDDISNILDKDTIDINANNTNFKVESNLCFLAAYLKNKNNINKKTVKKCLKNIELYLINSSLTNSSFITYIFTSLRLTLTKANDNSCNKSLKKFLQKKIDIIENLRKEKESVKTNPLLSLKKK